MSTTRCRSCDGDLVAFLDLGLQPLANSYLPSADSYDPAFRLNVQVCATCLLVQTDPTVAPDDIFTDYAFASGNSKPWLDHCARYAHSMMARFSPEIVIEVASNDGSLLAQFTDDVDVLGIDPAKNLDSEVPTVHEFFTAELASTLPRADLLIANNVLGHVPDINDFILGLALALAPEGVITIESPHLVRLIAGCQFDTIYHEHYNYWSLFALEDALSRNGLRVFDIDELDIHGGSLRYYVCHTNAPHRTTDNVFRIRGQERLNGFTDLTSGHYSRFQHRVDLSVERIRWFLDQHRDSLVVGIGAPAKANTLLNAVNATRSDIAFTTDTSPTKIGKYLPGSHIPVLAPTQLPQYAPDYVVIFPWNWAKEIMSSNNIHRWGGQWVLPPRMEIQ